LPVVGAVRAPRCALSGRDLLAVLFYAAGGAVWGATRIQLAVFLLQEELGVGGFAFAPSRSGPRSKGLADALRDLESSGALSARWEETGAGRVAVYRASRGFLDEGRARLGELRKRDPLLAARLCRLARIFASLRLDILLALARRRCPGRVAARAGNEPPGLRPSKKS